MVVSKRVGDVHPVITVLGLVMGLKFFGLPGLVFGPLLISYFIILMKLFYMAYANKTMTTTQETQSQMETNIVKMLLNKIGFFNPMNQGRKPNS
jgi:predicted PurR-regulated permease PerM